MNKKVLVFVCFSFVFIQIKGQITDNNQLHGLNVRAIGPGAMSGRVTAIDVVLQNKNIIYAGTASGGVWKSESGGVKWSPVFDDAPTQNIGAIAIQQNNPAVVWVGTGEGNPRNSQSSGIGIFKSIDGGRTWKNMGLNATKTIHRIIIHRDNPDIVYVGSLGSSWGPNPDRGVFKTTDGGKTWQKILFIDENTGCADLMVDPTNPNKLFAAMWEYRRQPWTFNSGGKGSGLYVSYDGGLNWTRSTDKDGLPKGNLGRIGLAISKSKPNIVYALIESKNTALYKSTDGGVKYNKVTENVITDRPFYYSEIYVDPSNENRLYYIHSLASVSEDGGKSFKTMLPYSGVHPDHHSFWINPTNPNHMIDGNDGGLNISYDGGENWRYADNIPVGQFYHIGIDNQIPYNIYGGLQDNGSWIGPSYTWENGPIKNHHWQEVLFGDGFDVVPDPTDNNFIYAMYQGGNLYRVNKNTGKSSYIKPMSKDKTRLRYNWNAAIAVDPFNPGTIFYGSQFVHSSSDKGVNWQFISPDLTTNDTAKHKQAISGGLTIDATAAENHTTILCIAPSSLEKGLIWVGTDDGNVQITKDGGKSWNNVAINIKGAPSRGWVPQIEVSPNQPGVAFVVINNYRQNDWQPYLFKTTDYGKTWARIVDESKVTGHVWCVVQDINPNLLFVGTEHGLWISFDAGKSFLHYTKNLPAVAVSDLKIQSRENDLVIGTFGRAIFVMDNIAPLRKLAEQNNRVNKNPVTLFSVPDAYQSAYKQASGVRFNADATWEGQNRSNGARVSFWLNVPDSVKKAGKKIKLTGYVYDSNNKLIRTHHVEKDSGGLNSIVWPLVRDGVYFPSWGNRDKKDDLPANRGVLPGRYRMVLEYMAYRDSAYVNVLPDPRADYNQALEIEKIKMSDSLFNIYSRVNKVFDKLKEAQYSIKLVDNALKNSPDSIQTQLTKIGKELSDSISKWQHLVLEPQGVNYIDDITKRLNDYFYNALGYIQSAEAFPGNNIDYSLKLVNEKSVEFINGANNLLEKEFVKYRKKVIENGIGFFGTDK